MAGAVFADMLQSLMAGPKACIDISRDTGYHHLTAGKFIQHLRNRQLVYRDREEFRGFRLTPVWALQPFPGAMADSRPLVSVTHLIRAREQAAA